MSEAVIADVVNASIGRVPQSVTPVHTAEETSVWEIGFDDGHAFFKAADLDTVASESWTHRETRKRGAAVPLVLATDLSCDIFPLPFLIMQKMTGARLSELGAGDPLRTSGLMDLGRQLRLFHGVAADGFGHISRDMGNARLGGVCASWPKAIDAVVDRAIVGLEAAALMEGRESAKVRSLLNKHDLTLDEGKLLHGDLGPWHVFVTSDGRVGGMIDPSPTSGDPLWDFTQIGEVFGQDAVAAMLEGYAPEGDMLERMDALFHVYQLVTAISAAYWMNRRGGDSSAFLQRARVLM